MPYPLEAMLPVHCVQLFYNPSEPATEDMLYEVERVRRFTSIRLQKVSEETIILNFRHQRRVSWIGEEAIGSIKEYLNGQDLMPKEGTILDASMIAAPPSRRNCSGEGDPEKKQSRKGNQWHCGMKLHIGVADRTGLVVHSMGTISAKMHDLDTFRQAAPRRRRPCLGDAGYGGIGKGQAHRDCKVAWPCHGAIRAQKVGQRATGAVDPTVRGQCEGNGGPPLVPCQEDVWRQQGGRPESGEERESAGAAAGIRPCAAGTVLCGVMPAGWMYPVIVNQTKI